MAFVTGSNTIIKENLLAKEVVRLLDKQFVVMPRANTMYEGEIKQQGDTVSIQTFPNISWSSGTTAGASITASTFTITKETLSIDQLAVFRVKTSEIAASQSNLDIRSKVAERMAYGQADLLEQYVVSLAAAGATSGNKLGAYATALTSSTVFAAIEAMRVKLSENNAFGNAALFVRPAVSSLLRQSANFDGFKEGLGTRETGYVGKMSGFTIYETNNIGKYMLALDKDSVHFAAQFIGFKQTEETDAFSWNILGELAYGGKVCTENGKRIAVYYHSN